MVVAVVLVLIGGGLLWAAIDAAAGDFSLQGPRLAPVVVTAAWVVIALVYLVRRIRRPEQRSEERPNWLVPLGVVACLAGFAVALEYAGFVVSAAVFVVAVAWVLGSRNLIRDVIVAVLLPLAVYFAFTRLLDIFLPAGVFPL